MKHKEEREQENVKVKAKMELFQCFTEHHSTKTNSLLSYVPRPKDVLEEWRYSST
jgi:hypothetical protein